MHLILQNIALSLQKSSSKQQRIRSRSHGCSQEILCSTEITQLRTNRKTQRFQWMSLMITSFQQLLYSFKLQQRHPCYCGFHNWYFTSIYSYWVPLAAVKHVACKIQV